MDKDYNIDINIQTNSSQVEQLNKILEETKKELGSISSSKINKDLARILSKAADPIKEAMEWLNTFKNSSILSDKQLTAGIVKTIEHSKQIKNINADITKEFEKQNTALKSRQNNLNLAQASSNISALAGKKLSLKGKDVSITEKMATAFGKFASSLKQTISLLAKTSQETKKTSGWFGKLMGRIRNISIYRAIRSGIKWLTSGVSEGIQGLAQYNSQVDNTISNIKNSLGQVRNTLAITFASVLQSIEPVIVELSDKLVDFINAFNIALAKMRGETIYDKAKKAADLYSKSAEKAKKLSFDTFEVLSGGDNKTATKDLFYPEEIEKDENALSKFFEKVIEIAKILWNTIKDVGKAIGEIIVDLQNNGVFEFIADTIKAIVSGIRDVIKFIGKLGLLKPILIGIAVAWGAIKIAAIGAAVANAAAFLFAHPLLGIPVLIAASAALVGIGSQIVGSVINSIPSAVNDFNASFFADGGIPNKSELFWMNENGVPEALVNTGGSQTNVINIDQLSEGMRRGFIQAIYDTDLIGAIREQSGTTLMVDKDVLGSTVANSAGFRNEMNRRNANLNLI